MSIALISDNPLVGIFSSVSFVYMFFSVLYSSSKKNKKRRGRRKEKREGMVLEIIN